MKREFQKCGASFIFTANSFADCLTVARRVSDIIGIKFSIENSGQFMPNWSEYTPRNPYRLHRISVNVAAIYGNIVTFSENNSRHSVNETLSESEFRKYYFAGNVGSCSPNYWNEYDYSFRLPVKIQISAFIESLKNDLDGVRFVEEEEQKSRVDSRRLLYNAWKYQYDLHKNSPGVESDNFKLTIEIFRKAINQI